MWAYPIFTGPDPTKSAGASRRFLFQEKPESTFYHTKIFLFLQRRSAISPRHVVYQSISAASIRLCITHIELRVRRDFRKKFHSFVCSSGHGFPPTENGINCTFPYRFCQRLTYVETSPNPF